MTDSDIISDLFRKLDSFSLAEVAQAGGSIFASMAGTTADVIRGTATVVANLTPSLGSSNTPDPTLLVSAPPQSEINIADPSMDGLGKLSPLAPSLVAANNVASGQSSQSIG